MEKKVDEIPHEKNVKIVEEDMLKEMKDSKLIKTKHKSSSSDDDAGSCNVCGPALQGNNSPFAKKLRFSIPLTPEEIKEDLFLLTGLKPTQKPKKRAEEAQKQLDKIFPGLKFALKNPDASNIISGENSPSPSVSSSSDAGDDRKSGSSEN